MQPAKPTEEEIFRVAYEISSPEARLAYLKHVCRDTAEVERIVALLEAGSPEASFLENGPAPMMATEIHSSEIDRSGETVGRYRLLQKIGEGGFGVVYMAEQHEPVRRKVALKIIKPGMDTNAVVARFEAERQALALMDHPNIARVLDGGATDNGHPYFVMELVKGVPVTEFCDKNRVPVRDRLSLLITICQAVQHAHQKGVIHRDLKPSNIMVTLHDGKPVVKVIDFGVSKAINQQLTEKTLFTAYGQMIGTPQYMSPEQAEMSGLDIDTRSDIYSLGVILYELLTGSTPLDAERLRQTAFADLQRIIREEEALKPSVRLSTLGANATQIAGLRKVELEDLRRYLSGDLDWIAMKALEKDRSRRYTTPADLADDIQRFLGDQPIEARPPSTAYALRKFARRNRSTVATVAGIALALVIGLIGTSIGMLKYRDALHESDRLHAAAEQSRKIAVAAQEQEARSRQDAVQARNEAIAESELRKRDLYFSDISLAYRLWDENNFHRVDEILKKYLSPKGSDYRGFEWRYLWKATERRRNAVEISFEYNPGAIGYSDDGSGFWVDNWGGEITRVNLSVVTKDGATPDISYDRTIVHAVDQGGLYSDSSHGYASFTISREDGAVLRSLLDETEIELKSVGEECYSYAFDRSRELVAAMVKDNSVVVFQTRDGQEVSRLPVQLALYGPLALSADGQLLAADEGDEISVWDVRKAELITRLGLPGDVMSLQFSPDGSQLAAGSELGETRARVWDTATWNRVADIMDHDDSLRAMAFSPNGRVLATGSRDGTIKLWETTSFGLLGTLKGHSGIIQDVVFSPDGKQLVSSALDYSVVIWKIDDLPTQPIPRIPASGEFADTSGRPVAYLDSRAIHLRDGRLYEFDPVTGGLYSPSISLSQDIQAIAANIQDEIAIAYGQRIELWKDSSNLKTATVPAEVTALAFSSGGTQRVAFGCRDGRVGCWDRSSGTLTVSTTHHPIAVRCVVFSPDNEQISSGAGSWGGAGIAEVMLWDVRTMQQVKSFAGHRDGITDIIFSADGEHVISSSLDNDIRVWDCHGASVAGTVLRGHTAAAECLLLDAGGQRIISGGSDRTVRIWDLATGQHCGLIRLEPGNQRIYSMCWSNNGSTLAGINQETGQLYVWHAASELP